MAMRGFKDEYGSWKTICIRSRRRRRSPEEAARTSMPSNVTDPLDGSVRRSRPRAVVVLPEPDSPTSARVSPLRISKVTPRTARKARAGLPRRRSTKGWREGNSTSSPSTRRRTSLMRDPACR